MRARIEPQARDELREAKLWYEAQRMGLGAEFIDAIQATVKRIQESPHSFPFQAGSSDVRRAFVERFPYVVVYLVHKSVVRILVVAHQHRDPAYGEQASVRRRPNK